jgi:hypothetical protein
MALEIGARDHLLDLKNTRRQQSKAKAQADPLHALGRALQASPFS